MREVGLFLSENSPKANNTVFERFRAVLHEGAISKRCQYMIEVLFQVRKDKYKDNPAVPEGLDLVEEEEQITHRITLDDELQVQESLSELSFRSTSLMPHSRPAVTDAAFLTDLFKVDPKFLDNEDRYAEIKREILGDSDDEDESDSEGDYSDEDDEDGDVAPEKAGITDMTETNLINLRRTIYLTIMNSVSLVVVSIEVDAHLAVAELRGSGAQAYEDQHPRGERGMSGLDHYASRNIDDLLLSDRTVQHGH